MTDNPEKKIIVDEDWKTQVERERNEALKTAGGASGETPQAATAPSEAEFPPASLTFLASSLAFQVTSLLGFVADPASGKREKNLPQAKHLIDLLEVLQQKTEGNRTPEESADIEAMLHQLRLAYVQVNN